jgi:predicted transcriptional regulator
MYELNFLQKVNRGAKDVAEGRSAIHEEVGRELAKWLNDSHSVIAFLAKSRP